MLSWIALAVSFQVSLPNGGPAALVYGSMVAIIGSIAISLSLAEMASMYVSNRADDSALLTIIRDPVVGAQYRWAATFAPSNPAFWALIQGMPL